MGPKQPGRLLPIRLVAELALPLVGEVAVDVVVVHAPMMDAAAKGVLSGGPK